MWKYSEMRQLSVETNYRSRPPRKMVKDRQRRCGVGDEFSNLCVFGTWLQCIFLSAGSRRASRGGWGVDERVMLGDAMNIYDHLWSSLIIHDLQTWKELRRIVQSTVTPVTPVGGTELTYPDVLGLQFLVPGLGLFMAPKVATLESIRSTKIINSIVLMCFLSCFWKVCEHFFIFFLYSVVYHSVNPIVSRVCLKMSLSTGSIFFARLRWWRSLSLHHHKRRPCNCFQTVRCFRFKTPPIQAGPSSPRKKMDMRPVVSIWCEETDSY